MEHVAIDLGGTESQVCVRGSDGTIVEELRVPTRRLGAFLRGRPASRVVLETGAEAFAVADQAIELGHEVRVVPCSLVKGLGVGARGVKNDRRDAQMLSAASCRMDLPSVHIPSSQSRERKTLCGMREALVDSRTKLINTVRGWMRTQTVRIATGASETFPKRVTHHLESSGQVIPAYVSRQLEIIRQLNEQIVLADRELALIAEQDPTCRRLMSVPGVGPVTSVRFVAALDAVDRFDHAHQVESYLGLVPGEDSSAERQRRTAITKAGSAKLRWALVQAAWSARRTCPEHPMVTWAHQIELRRGRRIAIVALARKIAGVLYAMWRDGSTYSATRGGRRIAVAPT